MLPYTWWSPNVQLPFFFVLFGSSGVSYTPSYRVGCSNTTLYLSQGSNFFFFFFDILHTVLVVRIPVYKTNSNTTHTWFITTFDVSFIAQHVSVRSSPSSRTRFSQKGKRYGVLSGHVASLAYYQIAHHNVFLSKRVGSLMMVKTSPKHVGL
jgi:hypothetical protein